jgi:hypothetical protein
VTGLGTWST